MSVREISPGHTNVHQELPFDSNLKFLITKIGKYGNPIMSFEFWRDLLIPMLSE